MRVSVHVAQKGGKRVDFADFLTLLCSTLVMFASSTVCAVVPVPILPANVVEAAGSISGGGQINCGSPASSNLVVTLRSSDTNSIIVPDSVTIVVGQSNVFFNLVVVDNLLVDGDRNVTISATFSGVTNNAIIKVVDNDPHHIRFGAIPALVDTNGGIGVLMTAENADGSLQTNFNLSLSMMAEGLEGSLVLEPTNSGNFFQGQKYLGFRVTQPGHAVRLRSLEYPGQSDAFTVIPPAFFALAQRVADAVWHGASHTLLASVPANGGVYSNCLVAIDLSTGLVTNSYPVGLDPSQIEISPDGNYLYIAISNRIALQRFDLNTRLAGIKYALSPISNPSRFASDFCVPPGLWDSVVVAARDQDNLGNVSAAKLWRYDTGAATSLPNFNATGGWQLESMASGNEVAVSPNLVRGNASSGAILATAANFMGTSVVFRDGQLFDEKGNYYSSGTLGYLGSYPTVLDKIYYTALPEVDSVLRRVFYLSGYSNYGSSIYKLKVYDRDLQQQLFQLSLPGTASAPNRFLRCGTNLLAYVTGDGQLWFIRPEATQPPIPAADLSLSYSPLPPVAVVGSNYTFTISLSNSGPGTASVILVTNALPPNVEVLQTLASTGSVAVSSSAFTWNVPNLAFGSNVTLQVTIRFNNAGWQTNTTLALGFEPDPVYTNNLVTLPLFVQIPPDVMGVFNMHYSSEDLLYDPVRDRLLLSVGAGVEPGQTNGLAVFNPYNGLTESFASLGKKPSRLARSDNGQSLYVSLPDDALVRRFNLPSLVQNLEFALGGEDIYGTWYPNYAADLAVLPGAPDSVIAWRVRRAGPMAGEYGHGLALFQNGIIGPNVTASGGSWKVEFDTVSDTLFGYNSGDLRRCSVDSNGVSFVEQYPQFYSAGSDIEYAAGRLFSSGGRLVQTQPFQVSWLFAGAESATLVEPDAATGRVFYLVQNSGWQIKVYDIGSRRLLGNIPIQNVLGTPSSLVRWGTNGLAFRTSSEQLFVIRSSLVQPQSAADLIVSLDGPMTSVMVGSNAVFTLTVTNQGPAQAANVHITNTFSSSVNLTSISATTGSWTTNGGILSWTLPTLDDEAHATLSYTINTAQTGVVTVTAAATTTSPDPLVGNNTAVQVLVVGAPLSLDGVIKLQIPASDVVWSPSLGTLLLSSTMSNSNWAGALISVDPNFLEVQFRSALGSDASRLSISRDDSVLYAGIDWGVAALPIPALTVTNRFLINPADPQGYAYDLKVAPGSNQLVVVGSRSRNNNSTWIGAYDAGFQRANTDFFYSGGLSLEFGDDSAVLYSKDYNANGFRSYTLDDQGITLFDSDAGLLPNYTAMDIVWGNGRIYSSVGKVINPVARTQVGSLSGIPAGSRVRYDAGSDRVFYLCPGSGQAVLMAFDAPTLLPVGNQVIPGVVGTLGGYVRWGLDGFAATTSSGQLVLFRSSLVATNPPADVAVTLTHSAAPYVTGSNVIATIVVTNFGPNPATGVKWNNTLPVGTIISSATSSEGSITIVSNTVTGLIPLLPVGNSATIEVKLIAPAVGILTNQISVLASSIDPAFANNSAAALLWIQPLTGLPATISLNLPVKDMEHDPVRPLLYASFGANAGVLADTVVAIDPLNGSISAPVRVGSNPGRLAASHDGQFLYVALDGAGTVQKLALPGLTPISSFAIPQNQTAVLMVVSPTNPEMVAIRRSPSGKTSLHVNGVQQPGELVSQDLFAFSQTTGDLFGCAGSPSNVKLYRIDTSSNGMSLLEAQPGKQSSTIDLKSSGGLLFFNRGMVLNPDTAQVRALMPVPVNSVVEPDTTSGRVFYLTPAGSAWTLRAFDIEQAVEVGAITPMTLASAPRRLMRWGADGLAYYNTNSQVVILRGQLVPTNPPVNVVLKQSFSTNTATTNDIWNVSLLLTNLGPVTASAVVVTQAFSLQVTNVMFTPSLGAASYTNGTATWVVGNLPTGVVASLTVTLRAKQTGTMNVSAAAYHNLNDVFWGDNTALGVVGIFNPAATNILQLRLSSRDIIYDSVRNVIYASTPASNRLGGNLIAVIDPATGEMKKTFSSGSEPGQLALSDDARYLNVALDGAMGVHRLDLQSNIWDFSFGFATNDIYFAQDLEVQPGHPDTVVASLGSYNFTAGYPSDVVIYDSGLSRSNRGGPARGLTFASDGSALFGYVAPGSSASAVRMWPIMGGFRTEYVPLFTSVPGELKFSNGRLYSSSGQVGDPFAGVLIGSMNVSGLQAINDSAGRAFYLAQKGSTWELRAFDLATLQTISTQTVAGVQGIPGGLIRAGDNRLAFRTSSNQVFLVRSPLVTTNILPQANLAVTQTVFQDFDAASETLRFTVTITNRGYGAASNVLLIIKPPSPVFSTTLQLPQGTSTNQGGNYLCNLGTLAAGKRLAIVLSTVITNTSSYSNFVSVSSSIPDPNLSDNYSLAAIQGLFFQRPDSISRTPMSVRDLAYDRVSDRLFASMASSNYIGWLDPQTAELEGAIPVGVSPDHLAISDDGQYLYVGSTSTSLVQRIHIPTKAVDFSFTLPVNFPMTAILVLPGQPHTLAVACAAYEGSFVGILDDGVARTNQPGNGFKLLAVSEDGGTLIGYDNGSTGGDSPDAFRMSVDSSGLTLIDNGPSDTPWGQNLDMNFSGGRIYFGNGDVLNTTGWILESPFPMFNYGQCVEIQPSNGKAIYAGVPSSAAQVGIYDLTTRQELALLSVPGAYSVADLTQCGADRLAFSSGSEIIFIRSSLFPAADVALHVSFATNQMAVGDVVNLQVVVSNAGPYSVSGIFLTNRMPADVNLVSVSVSQGTFSTNGSTIIASIGTLNTNATALLNLVVSPNDPPYSWVTNSSDAWSSNLPDPIPFNNHSNQRLFVLPRDSDHDGLPDSWELSHSLNPDNPSDAMLDSDGDGTSNLQEFLVGTDPFVFDELRITANWIAGNDAYDLTLHASVGLTYALETSTNLLNWSTLFSFIWQQTNQVVQAPFDFATPKSFYRLRVTTNLPVPIE